MTPQGSNQPNPDLEHDTWKMTQSTVKAGGMGKVTELKRLKET